MNKEAIRIVIIGAGSIGSLFGGYLASIHSSQYSVEVVFFCRKEHADEINKNGLIMQKNSESLQVKKILAFEKPNDYDMRFGFDYAFLSIKAHETEKILIEYKEIKQ